jgi:hypothetical protein
VRREGSEGEFAEVVESFEVIEGGHGDCYE